MYSQPVQSCCSDFYYQKSVCWFISMIPLYYFVAYFYYFFCCCQHGSKHLDQAFLHFFEQFRMVYVGDVIQKTCGVSPYLLLCSGFVVNKCMNFHLLIVCRCTRHCQRGLDSTMSPWFSMSSSPKCELFWVLSVMVMLTRFVHLFHLTNPSLPSYLSFPTPLIHPPLTPPPPTLYWQSDQLEVLDFQQCHCSKDSAAAQWPISRVRLGQYTQTFYVQC